MEEEAGARLVALALKKWSLVVMMVIRGVWGWLVAVGEIIRF